MVTGRSVSRTIRDRVIVRGRRRNKIINVYKPSRLRFTSNGHPDLPPPQSVCWWLQLPTCQLGLQQNIFWRRQPGLLGNNQQPLTAVQPKGSSQFLLSPMERRHPPAPGLCECWPGQPTAPHNNATEVQSSCLQRSRNELELSQDWLKALLPSHRWIGWEIATSRYNKHREGRLRI